MLVATHLLKAGVTVIIGQQWTMYGSASRAPKGCFLFGTANRIQAELMHEVRGYGHVVIGSDQEALPFAGAEFLDNVDPAAAQVASVFLVATEAHNQALAAVYPDLAIEVVGNPRIDLLRTANPARPISEPYVLFNTSFALTNSVWDSPQVAIEALAAGGVVDPVDLKERLAFEVDSKEHMMALLRWCVANLPWKIVVRPHPAENARNWAALAGDRVCIVSGQDPIPWIVHAKFMVHANSTTGLEAAILSRPCLNVSPKGHDKFVKRFVMHQINTTVSTAQEAAEAISDWIKTGKGLTSKDALRCYPENSASRIATTLLRFVKPSPVPKTLSWGAVERSANKKAKFTASADDFLESFGRANVHVGVQNIASTMLGDSVMMMGQASP
jgi:surface carbohydrate biosynthesis protein